MPLSLDFGPGFMLSVVFGIFGMGYFAYGKKQGHGPALVAGLGLMLFPYFVSDVLAVALIGVAFMALPFVARRFL